MTRDDVLQLGRERDALREAYVAARDARDQAVGRAVESLRRHREVTDDCARRAAAAAEEAAGSRRRHREATDARADAKRRADEAWRAYREMDQTVAEAVKALRGLPRGRE